MKRQPVFFFLVTLFCWLFLAPQICGANITCELSFARDGEHIIVANTLRIAPEYHAYAHEPGDTGRPATLTLSLVAIPQAQNIPVYYPVGQKQQDYYDPTSTVFVYKGNTILFARFPQESQGKAYTGTLNLLLCSQRQCLPLSLPLNGNVPTTIPDITEVSWADLWYRTEQTGKPDKDTAKTVSNSATSGEIPALHPRYDDTNMEIHSIWQALLFGLLAGLLLNLMPCVLPVITLKASALLSHDIRDNEFRTLRLQNASFSAGVLCFFTILAIALGTSGALWGQVFQNPIAVLCFLLILFILALSLFGVFNLPVIDLKIVHETQHPLVRAFLTGLLATLLATPCSGPFLGGVLAWSYTQPLSVMVIIFWAIGLGMAIPYLALACFPSIGRCFPKPGPWLTYFEKIMAFLLLASALYLFSLLPEKMYFPTLCMLLPVAGSLWLYGHVSTLAVRHSLRHITAIACFIIMAGGIFLLTRPHESETTLWQEYSPQQFASMLGRQAMFLEFTADWCPNCKFLEKTVLTPERLKIWHEDYGVTFVKVDISAPDAPGQTLLEQLGSKSIPLAALFPTETQAQQPLVIRDVYGASRLEKALQIVFGGQ